MDIELQVGLTSEQVDAIEQLARASRTARSVGIRPSEAIPAIVGEEFEALAVCDDEDRVREVAAVIGVGDAPKADAMFFAKAKACVLSLVGEWYRLTSYVDRLEAEVADSRAIRDAANELAATILRRAPHLANGKGLVPIEACRVAREYIETTRGRHMDDRSSMLS